MTILHLLLKFVLCMCLILNGSGRALAGGHTMAQAHAKQSTAMPAMHDMDMATGCDEGITEHQAKPSADTIAHNQTCPETDSGHSDCCQSASACGCACDQHSLATLDTVVLVNTSIGDTQVLLHSRTGHASPPPPRLIRPPIA